MKDLLGLKSVPRLREHWKMTSLGPDDSCRYIGKAAGSRRATPVVRDRQLVLFCKALTECMMNQMLKITSHTLDVITSILLSEKQIAEAMSMQRMSTAVRKLSVKVSKSDVWNYGFLHEAASIRQATLSTTAKCLRTGR